jgi:aryl-alcohol dehydrogenase-like predicted oxidoreductase
MEQRKLGTEGLTVSALGLGCMGMTYAYGAADEGESIRTVHRAIELGVTIFDTAEIYGPFTNEELLGRAIAGKRKGLVIATKFGFKFDGPTRSVDGSPANVKRVAEASLKRLNIDVIDLYYQHRRDPNVPIEETVGAMKELVAAGKIRYLGLSEVGPETLRRRGRDTAHRAGARHRLRSVQSARARVSHGRAEGCRFASRRLAPYEPPLQPGK